MYNAVGLVYPADQDPDYLANYYPPSGYTRAVY
jgi:hypothetical protein